jgi:hypothetical protein
VLSTGEAVYVGGHFRWLNNPFAGDVAGPGAVTREGLAALDPSNGLPLDWDPGRNPRGEGVWKLIAFKSSLWFGSDTCCVAGETHQRIAGFPIAGGMNVAPPTKVTLPSFLYRLPQASGAPGRRLVKRRVTSTKIGPASAVTTPGVDWSTARGAFFTNGWIYTGQSDGTLTRRTFDGTSVGPEEVVNLNGLDASRFPLSDVTGMFLKGGFLYYTVQGDAHLFYRYFTNQTAIVGAETFVARSGGVNWSHVQGMALAGNRLYFVRANGDLARIDFRGGGPVSGTERLVNRKVDWSSRGLFFRD